MTLRDVFSLEAGRRRSKSTRVLVLATDLSTGGGVNRVLTDLAGLFAERLCLDTTLVSVRNSAAATYPVNPHVNLRQIGDGSGLWRYIRSLWRLRKEGFTFAIGPWTQDNILLTLLFLGSGTRVVLMEHAQWHFHGWPVRLARRIVYPLAWRICALNPSEHAHYARLFANVVLMPNPVRGATAAATRRDRKIIAVGHLTPLKNFADTVQAMALSGLDKEGWSLTIVGDGPERERLSRMIGDLELIRTSIESPSKNIQQRYATASLLLHTSKSEVFPMVLAESMASGVIPIAYDADGRSFILEQFPELLVEFGNVEAFAKRLRELAAVDLTQYRESVRQSVQKRFSPAVVAERWRKLFERDTR